MTVSIRNGLFLAFLAVTNCYADQDLRNLRTSLYGNKDRTSIHSNKDGGSGGSSISAAVVPINNPNEVVVVVEDTTGGSSTNDGGVPPVPEESESSIGVVPPVDQSELLDEFLLGGVENGDSTEAIVPIDVTTEAIPTMDESAWFLESDICGPELAGCAAEGPCFDHTRGVCLDDGTITQPDCQGARLWCKPCFPNSRCGATTATVLDASGVFSNTTDICGPELASCALEGPCFDHTLGVCQTNGTIDEPACQDASFFCKTCFPDSVCGSTEAPIVHESGKLVESDVCGPELAGCALDGLCFDHTLGVCGDDGNNTSTSLANCDGANLWCKPCFPNSRCGSTEAPEADESGAFVPSAICGDELADCSLEGPCFDHSQDVCLADGTIELADCVPASLWCRPCFPNSRCGATEAPAPDVSGLLVESKECSDDLLECAIDGPCFDHTLGVCGEDGVMTLADCGEAEYWCKPCFPNSRCGSGDELLSFGKRDRHLRA